MRALVLGGSGFIGEPLAARLRLGGWDVRTVGRSSRADIRLDALDLDALGTLVREDRSDAVVNLLGTGLATAAVDPHTLTTVNATVPAVALAAALERPDPPVFLHAASSTERTDDVQPDESEYSRTKHEGALALRGLAAGASSAVALLRIHNTYGPGQPKTRFVAQSMAMLAADDEITLNFPHRVRDFVFVDDVVESFAVALDRATPGLSDEDIGTGVGTSLLEVARLVAVSLGKPAERVRALDPPLPDPHPIAVARTPGGTLGTCVTSLAEGIARTTGGR